jgi:hypothetical protein
MQMQMANLEEVLRYEKPVPHELSSFFKIRNIKPKAIAKFMNCSAVAVRSWLTGAERPTQKREEQLRELHRSVLRWEAKRGKMFDGKKV